MSKRITVVQYWGGGPTTVNSKYLRNLAVFQRCQQEGWRNYLVCCRKPEDPTLCEPFREAGCEVLVQPPSRRSFDLASVWRTYKLLRRLECDVFHCDNDHTSPLIGAVLAGVPVRIWSALAMSSYHEQGVIPRGWHRLMPTTRLSCLCAHRVLAISQDVRAELLSLGAGEERVEVAYGCVDVTGFAAMGRGRIRQELGVNASHVLITTVGCAIRRKGWDLAMRAFANVQRRIPNARLVLVGGTTQEIEVFRQLRALAENCRVSEYVYFLGHRRDFAEILKASDVFVFPSRSEGLPEALLEAMASGLPCVATRVGGIPEVISDGKDGLLFERENVEELATHLIRLIEDQPLRTRIASQGSTRVRAFSLEAYVNKVFECYRSLLEVHLGQDRR